MKPILSRSVKSLAAIFSALALFAGAAHAQNTYTWNASGTADWTLAGNWTPPRSAPATNDILLFNNAANTTVINVPAQTIGKLQVSANTIVNLQSGAVANPLAISTVAADALTVDVGSQLNLTGGTANALVLTNLAGAKASISGAMLFSGGTNKLCAGAATNVIFNSGSVLTQSCTGVIFVNGPSTSGTANGIVFASGSTMVWQAGSAPFSLSQPSSLVVFQTGSLFSDQSTSTPSWSGRTYANYEHNTATAKSPNGQFSVSIDNLTVSQGTLNITMTNNATSNHRINGNISAVSGATLNFAAVTQPGTINLAGSAPQLINGPGTISINNSVSIVSAVNQFGVTLNVNLNDSGLLVVPSKGKLNVSSGVVVSGTGIFTLSAGGTLGIASPDGITLSSTLGPIQTTTRNYSSGGIYVYNGAANQDAGNALPSSVGGLIITNTGSAGNNTVTLAQATAVSGSLQINMGVLSIVGSANVGTLSFDGGVTSQATGTWGASGSGATHVDDIHFAGTGTVNVQSAGVQTGFQYWDTNGSAIGLGGSGTWDLSTANWNLINDGAGSVQAYSPGVPIIFGGTPGIVIVDVAGVPVTALMAFDTNGYTIQGGPLTLSVGGTNIAVSNVLDTATINSKISGTAGFNKVGAGTLVLGGANDFAGAATITAGTLKLGAAEVIPDGQYLINNGTLDLNNLNERIAGVSGTGAINLGSATLTIGTNSGSKQFDGTISGTGGLIKTGTISHVLAGVNTFSGGILITQGPIYFRTNVGFAGPITRSTGTGTITISGEGQIGSNLGSVQVTNNVVVNTAALLTPVSGSFFELSGFVSGPGGFLRNTTASGVPTLSGNNTYSGGVKIDARTLAIGHKNALGTGTFTVGDPVTAPGTTNINIGASIDLTGVNAVTNPITINQDFTLSGTLGLEFSGPVTISAGIKTITVSSTATTKFSGIMSGPGGIMKAGTGTLDLTGANSYAGGTTVSEGALRINNISGSGTGPGAVAVTAIGTLTGAGNLSGSVAVDGTVAPGNGVGTLATGTETWGGGGHYIWEINSAAGTSGANPGWDKLSITGPLTITATSGSKFNIDLTSLTLAGVAGEVSDFTNTVSRTWTIAQAIGGITGFDTNAFALNTNGFANDLGAGSLSITTNATDVLLIFTAAAAAQQPTNFVTTSAGHGTFQGSPNTSYTIQYANVLATPTNWQFLMTVTTDGAGVGTFADPSAPSGQPIRFYRVKNP